ncbi:hypothetical protein KDW_60850 [Dictyobacter vulcani]|uniref:Putative mannosyltransferase YkcA/B-like C-terminal domain-containing protein n=1 Tax=Dictyobacter vulcani TaxID=2607529 RepID=A0A5J4KWR7_9CHLR|nr:hypothetical protein [Dictyobacter vulcani]GER91923.1 hypothetical protein KDW_60850 [Dictyobacter vulcani]
MTTNKPVMALGGFGGSDPILTPAELQSMINNGTVRYFWLSAPTTRTGTGTGTEETRPNPVGGFGRQNEAATWVTNNCHVVPTSDWQPSSSSSNTATQGGTQLYDCATTNS